MSKWEFCCIDDIRYSVEIWRPWSPSRFNLLILNYSSKMYSKSVTFFVSILGSCPGRHRWFSSSSGSALNRTISIIGGNGNHLVPILIGDNSQKLFAVCCQPFRRNNTNCPARPSLHARTITEESAIRLNRKRIRHCTCTETKIISSRLVE